MLQSLAREVPTAGLGKARGQPHHDFVTIKTEDIGFLRGLRDNSSIIHDIVMTDERAM